MSALHHCSTWCRSFFFSLPFPQIISHHREHNGPVENNLPPSVTVTLATSDTVGGRKVWWSLRTVLSLAGAAGAASFRQQVLLIQFCLFFFFFFHYYVSMGNPGSNNCHLAACKCSSENKPKVSLALLGAHSPLRVVTLWMSLGSGHLSKAHGLSYWLFSFWRPAGEWGGVHLFGRSLAIQPTTFCFEGQELSIRTLIS